MTDNQSLRDRVAVVTGATSGIGRAIAIALASAGAHVCLVGRARERLAAVVDAARRSGAQATGYEADLTVDAEIDRLVRALEADTPGVDLLVHSAGTIVLGPVADAPVDDFDRQYRTNLRSPYLLTQRLLPVIIPRRGQIIFINSSAGLSARGGVSQYAATKHGLKAVADSLREELHSSGVRVLSVFPGRTATPMQRALQDAEGEPFDPATLLDPQDLARLVVNTVSLSSAEVKNIDVRPLFG